MGHVEFEPRAMLHAKANTAAVPWRLARPMRDAAEGPIAVSATIRALAVGPLAVMAVLIVVVPECASAGALTVFPQP